MLRFLTAGESHGRALVVIVEGLPAGLPVEASDIAAELARRRLGYGRGPRMRFEADEISLVGGIRHGRTLGSPVAIEIANTEWPKWTEEMSPEPGAPSKVLTQPRPGHADLPGMLKYGFEDARDVLERASARETAARVAAGTLAKLLLTHLGVSIVSHIVALGEATDPADSARPGPADLDKVDESAVRCFDAAGEKAMVAAVKAAAKVGDSLGGVAEVLAYGVPVGLGSHVHWDRKLDANLAQALMSIQAVKGVEIGEGWDNAARRGSDAHDAIHYDDAEGYVRPTDRAGGIEGGISNGALLVARVAMKPLATLNRPVLETVDVVTKESTVSFRERTDVTAVPAMGVVAESMTALVLATEALRKFGGDSLAEIVRNRDGFVASLGSTPSSAVGPPSGAVADDGARSAESARQRARTPRQDDPAHPARRDDGRRQDHHRAPLGRAPRLGLPRLRCRRRVHDRADGARSCSPATVKRSSAWPRRRVLADACADPSPSVVSVAGGAVLSADNRRLLAPAASSSGCGRGPKRWRRVWETASAGRCSAKTLPQHWPA